jgi:hypothetical protein
VIFAAPEPSAREIVRVLDAGGRAVITAWRPEGTIHEALGVMGRALAELTPGPGAERFDWSDPGALRGLFEPHGARVSVADATLSFTAPFPEAWFDEGGRSHPMGIAGRRALEAAGRADAVRSETLAVLRAGNEDPSAFRATSRYVVATIST